MKKLLLLIGSVLLLCGSTQIFAQDSSISAVGGVLKLSLDDAVQMAIERNNSLKNASYDVKAAQANKWVAVSNMLPQIKASVDYSNMLGYKMDLGNMQISMPANATLGATASIAFSGAMVVAAKISDISAKMSDITLQKTEQEICAQTKELYVSAIVSEQIVGLLEKNVKSINKLYDMTLEAVRVGVSEKIAADQLKVQAATLSNTLSATKSSLEMVYNTIRVLLNLDFNTELVLTDGIDEVLDIESYISLMAENFDLDNNYDYQLVKSSADLSKQQYNAAKWSATPTLSAYYQYNYKKYFTDELKMNMTPPNMIGISLSIPVFSSLGKTKSIQAAKYSYEKQLNTLSDTEKSLVISHRQLCYDLSNAYDNFIVQKDNLSVTQQVYDNIASKYELGLASAMEMTTTSNNLIAAQSQYVQAVLTFINAQVELQKLLNK